MLISAALALLASALVAGFAVWIYLRRDLPVRPRRWLASVRALALVLLILLIWNPTLPARSTAGGRAVPWVGLDASRSMTAGDGEGAWEQALAAARSAAGDGARIVVLDDPGFGGFDLDSLVPEAESSELVPFLRRATEAGASEIRVLTDLRLDDAVAAAAEVDRPGPPLVIVDVGGPLRSAGIAELAAPANVRSGQEGSVAVEVFATGAASGAPARVTLTRNGAPEASWEIELPGPGTVVRREADVTFPDSAGPVRWAAMVELAGDVFDDDDRRVRITEVDPASGIVALVSFAPGWEPRFLLPVLAEVAGLPARGWLALGEDRFLPMGGGTVVSGAELRATLDDARILVVDGLGAGAPGWISEAVAASGRVLAFPADTEGADALGVRAGTPRTGEWYVTPDAPPSPLASVLQGALVDGLPPLTRVLGLAEGSGRPALVVQQPGGGPEVPALVLDETEGRRAVVALASGYWRWAFRPGEPRDVYRRLWSGAVAWLLELGEGRTLAGIAPERTVAPADRPLTWRAPEAAGGRIEIVIDSVGVPVRTDTLAVDLDGTATQPALGQGSWSWGGRILADDTAAAEDRVWRGPLETERWTDELRPPRAELPPRSPRALEAGARGDGLPLRTSPWPWLLVLGLICVEWIGRRRSGLR